ATGVGGILRDVFTMGARPVANLNALRFGRPDHPKMKHLVKGVVAGIGGYGNCVGVPTVGGETNFDPAYDGNIIANAMTVGVADADKIFYSAASGVGNPIVYVGSKTGRDGIHGATMASAEFDEDIGEKRPTVQVGDPFTEKLLIEACLELMASDAIVAIQDMGAAGLTSSSVEMATNGEVGIILDMDKVPCRETEMTAYEMMLSESQERMLMVLKPGREEMAEAIFTKWELDFSVIGEVTDTRRMVLTHKGETVCDIPLGPLADDAPLYDRPHLTREEYAAHVQYNGPTYDMPLCEDLGQDLLKMLALPALASRRWIWEQYDSQVGADTAQRSGGDAAVVRVHGTNKGLAIATDCTPRYVHENPYEGGKQAIAECYRNLTAIGAKPLATTDCMNFGNPEKPHIMAQFVHSIEGIGEACKTLNMPIVSGNVSLYNETTGADGVSHAILPTPAIGGVGLIDNLDNMATIAFKDEGEAIFVIGEMRGHIAQSIWIRELHGIKDGPAPQVDLDAELAHGDFVRDLINSGKVTAVHDVSDGGLLVALAEMAIASGIGATITGIGDHLTGFGEEQARYIVTSNVAEQIQAAGIPMTRIGTTGGKNLDISGSQLSIAELRNAHESFFRDWMED
ncbi:MAG: phosphoribosylformylglycinamidine synthase subunit PurL, partial [Parasphingorhabdus sp.]